MDSKKSEYGAGICAVRPDAFRKRGLSVGGDHPPASAGESAEAESKVVLDSAWEVENPTEGNLTVNEDGSITIRTEGGTIDSSMNNVLYYQLPNSTDYDFTVKVSGEFTADYQGAHLIIASGKNLENAVGVVRRYHGNLGGNYGTNLLMGVMQDGNPSEYYEAADDIGNEFYLKLQKQNGRITGFYAEEYSDNDADWNQIIDPTKGDVGYVDKGSALIDPENVYLAIAAANGGGNTPTEITFSDLRVGGIPVAFTADPSALNSVTLTGEKEMEVDAEQQLILTGTDYEGNEITEFDSVTYTSSDEDVAVVDEKGVVTGLTNGNAVITAEAVLGGVTKTASLSIQVGDIVAEETWKLSSPDGSTEMTVELLTGGTLQYRAEQNGVENIGSSPLGLVTSVGDFSKGLVFKEASAVKEINDSYTMISGKSDVYTDHCNEQTLTFTLKNDDSVEFDLIMRVYDDGTAYRYAVRTEEEGTEISISDETSGLQLPEGADVYWMDYSSSTWNYEGQYQTTTTEDLKVNATPSIPFLYGKDGVWTLFSEADLNGTYCGSMFTVGEGGLLDVSFCKTQGTTPVVTTTPFKSPWRAAITGGPEDIVENTMIENLSTPADYEIYDYESWVEPGLSSWSWVANWGSGISDQSKAETHLNWIEFGGEIGWKYYILDEGWNEGGRGNYSGMRDWWPEVKAFAEENGVKLWVWVHVSDIDTQEERDRLFKEWSEEGIVGVKPDFFDGEDQAHMQLYDDLYKDAAKYHLMLLVHGANKPTGEIRTYPNVYGREAIRGQESGGITAEQYTLIPFIRAAIGPAEVTEEIRSKDYSKTTMGFQIALTALIEDGIHSMGSVPDAYRSIPEAMSYYTDYPDGWDDTEFVDGEVGEYLSIARKAGNSWYVSGISVDSRQMEAALDFLDEDTEYTALLYKENGRQDIDMEIITGVTSETVLNIDVLYGGGYALHILPRDEVDGVKSITAQPSEVTVEEGYYSDPVELILAPEDAKFQDVVWSSTDENIATVDQNGVIKGITSGQTTVTVRSAFDENVKAEIKVTVEPARYVLDEKTWSILNKNDNVLINSTDSVTITTEQGVLGENNWNNMFAMDVPDGNSDFTITAKVSGGLNADYQGGFITVFDKDNPDGLSVAAGRRHHSYLMGSHPQSLGVMTNGGSIGEFYCADENYDSDVYLKIAKEGNTFICSYSYDGEAWTEITNKGTEVTVTNDRLAASENLCAGFYVGSGGGSTPIDVTISEFTFNGEKIPVAVDTQAEQEEISTAVLEYALNLAEEADTDGVAASVVKLFNEARAEAQDVLTRVQSGDKTVTQEMVDQSWMNLIKAMQYLSFKQGDKTDLQKVINLAYTIDLTKYLEVGQQAFADALAAAEDVLADGDAMQDEVDQAWRDLLKAMSELRLKPNKDALEALINEANDLSTENADEETAAVFRSALAMAVDVYENEQATEDEVTAAYEQLHAAVGRLMAESGGDSGAERNDNAGSTGEKKTVDSGQTSENNAEGLHDAGVKTGDRTDVWILIGAMITALSAGAIMVCKRRR